MLKIDGVKQTCLIPYADMFNHRSTNQANCFYDYEKNGFVIEAAEDIPIGAEICFNYGAKKTNFDLFMNFGFLNQESDSDMIKLKLEISPDYHAYQTKITELESSLHRQEFTVFADLGRKETADFIAFARFIVLTPEHELNLYRQKIGCLMGLYKAHQWL